MRGAPTPGSFRSVAQQVDIRRCVPGDEGRLSLLGQATFLEAFAGVLPAAAILAHCARQHAIEIYRAWLADSGARTWIAEAAPGGAPVGYVVLATADLPIADPKPDDREVKRVYLLHRFQGGGLGRRLMDAARREASAIGARRLLLGVYERNEGAIGFYERLGYRRVGTRSFQVGDLVCRDLILGLDL